MKKSQFILLAVFIVITGLIYMVLSGNRKDVEKEMKSEDDVTYVPIEEVKNEMRTLTITSYGQINPNAEVIVSMEVQGKLEKGQITMKPGVNFSAGQILYRVDQEEAFYAFSAQKTSLANVVLNILPEIEMDFPDEREKWARFINGLNPENRLPELPAIKTRKEQAFLVSRNVITQYYNLKSQEARLDKYIYTAPFNGTVIDVYAEPGSIANPGGQLAKIAKTGEFEVKVPISMEDLTLYKERSSAIFMDANGKEVATGKIIRVSDVINQQTQSADVYYSIKANSDSKIYNGMYVNVSINQQAEKKTMTLPRVAVKNGKVNVLEGNKVKAFDVLVVNSKPDSVFVTGLKNGQRVILEQIEDFDPKHKYEGISR